VPGASCPRREKEGVNRLRITFEATHDINQRNDLLYVGFGAGHVLRVTEHWAWKDCKARREGDAVTIDCPPGPMQTHGRFWLQDTEDEGTVLRFEWRDTVQYSGAVVLPCDARPTLEVPDSFAGGIHNYG
jgi:hypothetical protein